MSSSSLEGHCVLVVGASSGIGRAIGLAAAAQGAAVAFAARRLGLVEEAADAARKRPVKKKQAKRSRAKQSLALRCDVRDPKSCTEVVEIAADRLGGLDVVVYAPAMLPLGAASDVEPETWQAVFETNVIGAALVTTAALPALIRSRGRVAYLSSDASSQPRPGLVPYGASKAALDALLTGFRAEVPEVGFLRVVLGATNTGVPPLWDLDEASKWLERWSKAGYPETTGLMDPGEVANQIVSALASPMRVEDLVLEPEVARQATLHP